MMEIPKGKCEICPIDDEPCDEEEAGGCVSCSKMIGSYERRNEYEP